MDPMPSRLQDLVQTDARQMLEPEDLRRSWDGCVSVLGSNGYLTRFHTVEDDVESADEGEDWCGDGNEYGRLCWGGGFNKECLQPACSQRRFQLYVPSSLFSFLFLCLTLTPLLSTDDGANLVWGQIESAICIIAVSIPVLRALIVEHVHSQERVTGETTGDGGLRTYATNTTGVRPPSFVFPEEEESNTTPTTTSEMVKDWMDGSQDALP